MKKNSADMPDWAKCAITGEVMTDPVITANGENCERAAAMKRYKENPDPMYKIDRKNNELKWRIETALKLIAKRSKVYRSTTVSDGTSAAENVPRDVWIKIGDLLPLIDKKHLAETSHRFFDVFQDERNEAISKSNDYLTHVFAGEDTQAAAMLAEDHGLFLERQTQVTSFLIHTVRGNLNELEKMLKRDPSLLLAKGRILDLGKRRFLKGKGITALQYADAAGDEPVLELFERYWPIGNEAEITKQREEGRDKKNKNYPALYDLREAIATNRDALGKFIEIIKQINSPEQYYALEKKADAAWRLVCETQLKLPAWVIFLMTEYGKFVAWHNAEIGGKEAKSRNNQMITRWYTFVGKFPERDKYHQVGVARGYFSENIVGTWAENAMSKDEPKTIAPLREFEQVLIADHQKLSQLSLPPELYSIPEKKN